jgi:hypothetical protein
MSLRSRLRSLKRRLEAQRKLPPKPASVALSRRFLESLPRTVFDAIYDAAVRKEDAGVAVDWYGPNPFDELDLPEQLKAQLREALAAGCWCGPKDWPDPCEVPRPAAEPPAGQQAAQTVPAAAAERPTIVIPFDKPPRNRLIGGVPERHWRRIWR